MIQFRVFDLVARHILLYFSAHWFEPRCDFQPKLVEAYHKIKAKDDSFEVVFISNDSDKAAFDENFSRIPRLALPFSDKREALLSCKLKVYIASSEL